MSEELSSAIAFIEKIIKQESRGKAEIKNLKIILAALKERL